MGILANLNVSAANTGSPAQVYISPTGKVTSGSFKVINRDPTNVANLKMYLVKGAALNPATAGTPGNASLFDNVNLPANFGSVEYTGLALDPGDALFYETNGGALSITGVGVTGIAG